MTLTIILELNMAASIFLEAGEAFSGAL